MIRLRLKTGGVKLQYFLWTIETSKKFKLAKQNLAGPGKKQKGFVCPKLILELELEKNVLLMKDDR